MCVDLKILKIIYRGMFPYNDEENAWITKPKPYIEKTKDD